MNEIDRYIQDVLHNIWAPPRERQRVEGDLRAHLQEALDSGEPPKTIIARMGSPIEVAAEFMSQVSLPYASFGSRLAAFGIDMALIIAMAGVLAVLCIVLSNWVPREPRGGDYVLGALLIGLIVGCGGAAVGTMLLYFPILEALFGQTVGKRLLALRVLHETGRPPGYKEAFLRRLSFYFDMIAVDALFILFTAKRQRAFDMIAATVVIQEKR